MPTKKELQQKINDLEKLVKEKEGNFNDFVEFIKTLNLWDIFVKTMKTDILVIDEVKYAINTVCPCCNKNEKEKAEEIIIMIKNGDLKNCDNDTVSEIIFALYEYTNIINPKLGNTKTQHTEKS